MKRATRELTNVKQSLPGCPVRVLDEAGLHWEVTLSAPVAPEDAATEGAAAEAAHHVFSIVFPIDYPFKEPKVHRSATSADDADR